MTRLSWHTRDSFQYSTGLDRGVFYDQNGIGVPWNGLVSVDELVESADTSSVYFDGIRTANPTPNLFFAATINAFTYPDEFEPYSGHEGIATGQKRKEFGFSYRTLRVINGVSYNQIHLIYNVMVSPSSFSGSTLNETLDAEPFSWTAVTKPVKFANGYFGSHIIVDESIAWPQAYSAVEDLVYGSEDSEARLPTPDELVDLFEQLAVLRVIDNGDGSFTVIGPDSAIVMLDDTTFEITWPSAVYIGPETYQISSL